MGEAQALSAGDVTLHVASSMATREVLAELARAWSKRGGIAVELEAIAGVALAQRVRAGEAFDVVVLADDVLAALESEGHILAGSRVPVADSAVALAVPAGAAHPDLSSEAAVREAIRTARRVGYSTGPSGSHLKALLAAWGLAAAIEPRLLQAPPGVPVATLVASGEASLGFQQLSELVNQPGIEVAGVLPPAIQRITTFAGGVGARSTRADDARAWLAFLAAAETSAVKRRHGMEPPA